MDDRTQKECLVALNRGYITQQEYHLLLNGFGHMIGEERVELIMEALSDDEDLYDLYNHVGCIDFEVNNIPNLVFYSEGRGWGYKVHGWGGGYSPCWTIDEAKQKCLDELQFQLTFCTSEERQEEIRSIIQNLEESLQEK